MEKLHLFFCIWLFCALISLTFIFDHEYQQVSVVNELKRGKLFRNLGQNSLFDLDYHEEKGNELEKHMKIVIWLNPRLPKDIMEYRKNFVREKIIIPQNTGNECFNTKFNCKMSIETDENKLREADAIIFIEFAYYFEMRDLPPNWEIWRRPDQIWAIQIDESPIHHSPNLLEVFNWTLSYRRDSTIWLPYGKTVQNSKLNLNEEIKVGLNEDIHLSKWIKNKSKLVTGVISNCYSNSKRENILEKMMKSNNNSVDIYGHCGNRDSKIKCGFYEGECNDYWNNLAKVYKFYLAFENSLCVDYVTEKFWRTLRLGMVPVVYGGADYEILAPKGSYIDVSWFKSGEELMGYLERVGENEEEYSRFFEWRRYFNVREEGTRYMTEESGIWCEFCEKLRDFGKGKIGRKMVKNDWWRRMEGFEGVPCTNYEEFLRWEK